MTAPSFTSALDAAVRAVRGESDLDVVMPALENRILAWVIACAPNTDPLVRAVAALRGGLPALLNRKDIAAPALHDAMARLIGTPAGRAALRSWAEMAPAGWGAAHAEALITAVHATMVDAGVAAALIGPNDTSAGLLHASWDVAFAVRRWGQGSPAAPTVWATAIAPAERDRLITAALRSPPVCVSCIPWLPPDGANRARIDDDALGTALDAFAEASSTSRVMHAEIVQRLVDHALPAHLEALTRLACVMGAKTVWRRVQTLIRESPDDAWRVVVAASWDDLPENVRAAILTCADRSPVCAAVAAARGRQDAAMTAITEENAVAFFAALDPAVWAALTPDAQRRWRQSLDMSNVVLAVRALGLRPEILAQAPLTNDLVRAVQWHTRDAAATRATLLQVALRMCDPAVAHALIAAMPTPDDPGAFFVIAGGHADVGVVAPARAALRTTDALAVAVTIQRCCGSWGPILDRCVALQRALRGRSDDDLTAIMPLLDAPARAALMPDADTLAGDLARPDQRDALRRTLETLATLPPAVAVPTFVALTQWTPWNALETAAALAVTLRAHGDVVLELADALADDRLRAALLPMPDNPALVRPLRELTHDDPVTGTRLAHAILGRDGYTALLALLHAPPAHAAAVWQALDNVARRGVVAVLAAAPPDADSLAVHDPIAALALAALLTDDVDLQTAGGAALTARRARIRAIWGQLPPEMQQLLGDLPAFADLMQTPTHPARRGLRCRRA